MDQGVFCIDSSREPALLVAAKLQGEQVEFDSVHEFNLNSRSSTNGEQSASSGTDKTDALSSVINHSERDWIGPITLLSGKDYLSLNVELPISNKVRIDKIIEMEIQDLVPFELSDFAMQHRVVGKLENNAQDVHVAVVPRERVQGLLDNCRALGTEPLMILSPTSALSTLYELYPKDSLEPNCALAMLSGSFCYIVGFAAGKVRFDRILDLEKLSLDDKQANGSASNQIEQQIGLTLMQMSQRLEMTLSSIYLVGAGINTQALSALTKVRVEQLELPAQLLALGHEALLAALACRFATTRKGPAPLVDFRSGEFAYRAPIRELLAGLRKVMPWLVWTFALGLFTAAAIYLMSAQYLNTLRSGMATRIRDTLNDTSFNPPAGQELTTLLSRIETLNSSLASLGSPSKINALTVLAKLSRTINKKEGASIRQISLKGPKVIIQGDAPDYAYVEELERIFKRMERRGKDSDKQRRNQIYCGVEKKGDNRSAMYANALRQFTFELKLCD